MAAGTLAATDTPGHCLTDWDIIADTRPPWEVIILPRRAVGHQIMSLIITFAVVVGNDR